MQAGQPLRRRRQHARERGDVAPDPDVAVGIDGGRAGVAAGDGAAGEAQRLVREAQVAGQHVARVLGHQPVALDVDVGAGPEEHGADQRDAEAPGVHVDGALDRDRRPGRIGRNRNRVVGAVAEVDQERLRRRLLGHPHRDGGEAPFVDELRRRAEQDAARGHRPRRDRAVLAADPHEDQRQREDLTGGRERARGLDLHPAADAHLLLRSAVAAGRGSNVGGDGGVALTGEEDQTGAGWIAPGGIDDVRGESIGPRAPDLTLVVGVRLAPAPVAEDQVPARLDLQASGRGLPQVTVELGACRRPRDGAAGVPARDLVGVQDAVRGVVVRDDVQPPLRARRHRAGVVHVVWRIGVRGRGDVPLHRVRGGVRRRIEGVVLQLGKLLYRLRLSRPGRPELPADRRQARDQPGLEAQVAQVAPRSQLLTLERARGPLVQARAGERRPGRMAGRQQRHPDEHEAHQQRGGRAPPARADAAQSADEFTPLIEQPTISPSTASDRGQTAPCRAGRKAGTADGRQWGRCPGADARVPSCGWREPLRPDRYSPSGRAAAGGGPSGSYAGGGWMSKASASRTNMLSPARSACAAAWNCSPCNCRNQVWADSQ